jgi:uncharacterized membrane protein YecN with MAPEG domain
MLMKVVLGCIAAMGFLVFALGFGVSSQRRKQQKGMGLPDDTTNALYKWGRAHGNTVEYVPTLAILMYALAAVGAWSWTMWICVVVALGRYIYAFGIVTADNPAKSNPGRLIGAVTTYFGGMAMAVILLLKLFL